MRRLGWEFWIQVVLAEIALLVALALLLKLTLLALVFVVVGLAIPVIIVAFGTASRMRSHARSLIISLLRIPNADLTLYKHFGVTAANVWLYAVYFSLERQAEANSLPQLFRLETLQFTFLLPRTSVFPSWGFLVLGSVGVIAPWIEIACLKVATRVGNYLAVAVVMTVVSGVVLALTFVAAPVSVTLTVVHLGLLLLSLGISFYRMFCVALPPGPRWFNFVLGLTILLILCSVVAVLILFFLPAITSVQRMGILGWNFVQWQRTILLFVLAYALFGIAYWVIRPSLLNVQFHTR
jgi:hypothetical protein